MLKPAGSEEVWLVHPGGLEVLSPHPAGWAEVWPAQLGGLEVYTRAHTHAHIHTQTRTELAEPFHLVFLIVYTGLAVPFPPGRIPVSCLGCQCTVAFPFCGRASVSLALVVSPRLQHLPPSPKMPPWGIWWCQLELLFKLHMGVKL